ncbi:MAG TPA: SAM-dependent methyltransferase [Candidatus Polarisedimenticolia bacterium]|nr:SAM-dependent methyltransferase [Candidatus Polarisedimenticolia bacterium]
MERHPASFRDDAGFLFRHEGTLYRAVCGPGREDYDLLIRSGLYDELSSGGLLVPHDVVAGAPFAPAGASLLLAPRPIPFISYPYEWSFGQLKDAALLTLEVQRRALARGMSLKDASFFNVQFAGSRPVFIDTLSFQARRDAPWVAYRQFCEHFLGPLALMAMTLPGIHRYLAARLDGFPLEEIVRLLPVRARLRPGLLMHLHLHRAAQRRHASGDGASSRAATGSFGLTRQLALVDSLSSTVERLRLPPGRTQWGDYAAEASHYSPDAAETKRRFVQEETRGLDGETLWDLGGNTGDFSRIGAANGLYAVCFDQDHLCVQRNYARARAESDQRLLPLLLDLANPSPAAGWAHRERESLAQRGPAGMLLALALVHHLRVTANVPFEEMIPFLAAMGRRAIVEFVPRDDPMTRRILGGRDDPFHDFEPRRFEEILERRYVVKARQPLPGTGRTLYALERR